MGPINKLTKLVLSFLLGITCINFSVVQAEDGSDENYSEPTAVETISEEPASEPEQEVIPEEPVAEEPVIEEAAPVEGEKQEEVTPEVMEEAKVEEENNTPEIEAEPATQEETVEPEVQQEAPVEPEVQKVETVEEVKVTVVVSYVDENDHPLTDPITGSYPIEYRLDENVDAFKSFDGYAFEKVIVNDDAKNTISKDDVQKNGFRITKDMTSLKLVYQKMNLESESKEVIPEVTEEAVEEAEPESNTNETELSAFDQTAFAGKVGVHASAAEGVLPKGARLIVEQVNRKAILNAVENTVSDNNKEMDSAVALDISIVDKDGVEIQPNGVVNITFVNTGVSGNEVKIYHVEDDASAVTEIANNTDSFDASHFSIYVITGENEVPLTTFNFVDVNGQTVSTQIVKTGDTLITPTAPDVAGKAFVEWQENGSKFDGFGEQTITKTETRTITAKYEDALYVYFYNPEGTQIMRTEKVGNHEAHDFTAVSYEVDSTHKLVGWAKEVNGTNDIAKNITVLEGSTSVNVYAIIKKGNWVTFDSDGGSAIDSQFVFDKISLNDQTTPTKPGYRFDGWYNGSTKIETGATVTSSMTLKARWKAAQVNYTVIHWWENADDDGYSFHESQKLQGLTGETTEAVAKSYTVDGKNIFGESVNDKVFNATTIEQKTIKGDGSTIVNVYYKRKTYTMHFKESGYPYNDLSTITKKWGQSISKNEWPTYYGNGNWRISSSKYLAYTSTMPMEDSTLWSTSGNYTYKAYYYVQKVDGNGYDLHHTDTIKMNSNPTIGKEDCYAISGFTFEYCNPKVGSKYNGAKFYYTRNSYKIKFINKGKEDKSVEKKYEQSISGENYTPTRPSALPEYYVFDGWYENELCEGEAYDFTGKKMPAQNVTLYAKWTASKVKLTYNLNNPEGTVDKDTKNVEAGTVASTELPSIPTINDYSFAGWYYADGNGNITSEVFHTKNTITRDTSIVGKWLYKGELRVVYDPDTETGATVPTDDKVYAGGARVTVAGNATTTSNKKFLGWKLNGNLYHPGDAFEVNKDIANQDNQIILTATWGNAETSTTLTYDPGNGIGTTTTVDVMNNEAVQIEAHGSLGFTAPVAEGKEYYFAGWADSKTGNATYADGQTINIDANGENVLYAVWVEKAEITLVANSGTRTYNGAEQSIEGFESTTMNGYTVSGLTAVTKGTNVGEYTNTVFDGTAKVEKDGVDVTDKVAVKTRAGKLVITPKSIKTQEITVTKPADSQYDGNEHKWSPTVTDKADKKLEAVTDYTVEYSTSDFTNVTGTITVTITGIGNYTGTVVRTYAITPAEVTVTANNANKVYGENDPELKATVTGTLNNDTVDYTVTRDPGEDVDKYAIHVTGDEDQGNYHVTYTAGEFEITKSGELILTAELTGESATKVYDGNPLAGGATSNVKEGTTITYSTDGGATWTTEVPSITNVGTLNITARAENPNYEPAETTYSLTVTHATAIVTAENKTKVYGTADPELTATVSGTLGNDTVAYTLARKAGENAGKYKITVTGEENQGNYKVTYTPGTFEITPKSIIPDGPKTPEEKKTGITVTAPEGSKYDGEEHKNKPTVTDTKTGKTLTEETDYTLTYSEDVTNAGKATVTVTGIGNYTGEFDVTYEITKRDVVLTSATDSKPYDGTALRNENVEVTGDGFAAGEGATFAVTGTITNVGTKANTFGYALNKNTLASNYNISTELGTLTITPKSIIPDGPKTPEDKKTGITVENPGDVKYDGKDHAEKPVIKDEKTGVTLEEGKDYEIVYPEDIKNAGEITATVVGKGDYEGSFEIKYNITKRDVTFTSATDSKQYDGNALTNGNVEITGDGFIEGEGAEYKVIGTQTQVGNSANEFEYTLNENTLASNYDITKVVGTLTVTAAPAPETPEKPKPEVKKSVDTSDDNNIVFYGNAFFMAMITLAGIIVLRKKSS
ncbi:MBG domain-containing protein [Bulleidia sp. HCP3S3_C9]|uniref:MBG domain-containing protein n=1 Tax=Bulleidia sp. HCP3S3_C9 TaxID=3438914 RepID=UPI003F8C14A4